jgi:hypothetical protein
MKETLQVINKMQVAGIIGKYTIGGAIAVTFYAIEPTATFDIDIFFAFNDTPPGSLVSLAPIYDYLRPLGYHDENEHIMIEGWQVQFLPADDPLNNEALEQAVMKDYLGVKTWVMTAEHLMAIALRTGRSKDFIRVDQFINDKAFDEKRLQQILARHRLVEKWKSFNRKFAGGNK